MRSRVGDVGGGRKGIEPKREAGVEAGRGREYLTKTAGATEVEEIITVENEVDTRTFEEETTTIMVVRCIRSKDIDSDDTINVARLMGIGIRDINAVEDGTDFAIRALHGGIRAEKRH